MYIDIYIDLYHSFIGHMSMCCNSSIVEFVFYLFL